MGRPQEPHRGPRRLQGSAGPSAVGHRPVAIHCQVVEAQIVLEAHVGQPREERIQLVGSLVRGGVPVKCNHGVCRVAIIVVAMQQDCDARPENPHTVRYFFGLAGQRALPMRSKILTTQGRARCPAKPKK